MLHTAIQTPLNADFAAFCPVAGLHHLLAVGTYQLDETSQTRLGRLHIYDATRDSSGKHDLAEIGAFDQPGIFGMDWLQSSDWGPVPCLVLALADGSLRLMQMKEGSLEASSNISVQDSGMVLSVEGQRQAGRGRVLAASTASGQAALVQARESTLEVTNLWSAHELEVWTAVFDNWQGNLLHTGADDSVWHGWDMRDCDVPAFSIRKEHKAGVCCIQSHPQQEHIICTGSYDESARIWDCRAMARPLLTAKLAAGGGVWRLQWHPTDSTLLLAACMQEGFKVLRCASNFSAMHLQQHYDAQRTLAYGADWSYAADQPQLVATCSFYDRQVHLWQPMLEENAASN